MTETNRLKEALAAAPCAARINAEIAKLDAARAVAAEPECAALRAENQHLRAIEDGQRTRAEKAEDECATLRAKLIDREEKFVAKHAQLVAVESRLAAANALLCEIGESQNTGRSWRGAIRDRLTNQPAGPAYQQQRAEEAACAASDALLARPTFEHPGAEQMFNQLRAARSRAEGNAPRADLDGRTPREMRVSPARTRRVSTPAEAAQAVLDAMAAVTEGELGLWITYGSRGQIQVAKAELARRKERVVSK